VCAQSINQSTSIFSGLSSKNYC